MSLADRILLRPALPDDLPILYRIFLDDSAGGAVRFHGATPSYPAFVATFGEGVLCQHSIIDTKDDRLVGLAVLSNPDFANRVGYFSIIMDASTHWSGLGGLAALRFLTYVFGTWEFRKLCADVADFNLPRFASVSRFLRTEGVRERHVFWRGQYHDVVEFAVWREDLESMHQLLLDWEADAEPTALPDLLAKLEELVQVDVPIIAESRFSEDLQLDSIAMVELLLWIEQSTGITVDGVIGSVHTVGELASILGMES